MKLYYLILMMFLTGCSSGSDDEIFESPDMMEKGMEEKE